jgi:XTP/dITP diphosphohydrolase
MRLVLATANPDKVREVREVLGERFILAPRPDQLGEVEENGTTLEANARLKADAICSATGLPALADDTGLEVDALGGAPGVHSSRYAGNDGNYSANVDKLLRELRDVAPEQRTARFRTVAMVRFPDGGEVVGVGVVEGVIAEHPRGEGGFGYDPVFLPRDDAAGRTFAEMPAQTKHAISHRGRALRALAHTLESSGLAQD